MKSERYQQAIQNAVEKCSDAARTYNHVADRVNHVLNRQPYDGENQRKDNCRAGSHNRHETPSAEEAQKFGQLDFVKAIVQETGSNSADNSGEHAHVNFGVNVFEQSSKNRVANVSCQARRAVVVCVLCQAERDTDCKNYWERVEDCLTCQHDERNVEHVA